MHVVETLHQTCHDLASRLNDSMYLEECQKIKNSTLAVSVIEYAASTLIASLAYQVSQLYDFPGRQLETG